MPVRASIDPTSPRYGLKLPRHCNWRPDRTSRRLTASENVLDLSYQLEPKLSADEFQQILVASTLAERRPADDLGRLDQMLRHADIVLTARDSGRLVGISRAITDFSYCCYLSDLAVDVAYQRKGVGKRLIAETHRIAGENTTLLLVAAPAAETYYPSIGMKAVPRCWSIPRNA